MSATRLILKNVILWNTPLGTGYNTAASANVIEQDPLFAGEAAMSVNGVGLGIHQDQPNVNRIIRIPTTGLELNKAYTLAVKMLVLRTPGSWGNGKTLVDVGTNQAYVHGGSDAAAHVQNIYFDTPIFGEDKTFYVDSTNLPWGTWTGTVTTPATLPEGQTDPILTANYFDSGLLIDWFELRDATTGDVVFHAEAEDGTWDNTTNPLYRVDFQWYSGTTDAHLGDGSPAIDAGDDTLLAAEDVTDLDGQNRFHDGNGDEVPTVDIGCYEYQGEPGATVASFVVSDRTSGSTLVTNEAAVTVAITVNVPEGLTVDGWLVTESATAPTEGWLPAAPASYAIQAASGAEVTLYAWIVDSTGKASSKSAAIYYNSAAPVVSAIAVVDNGDNTATATWLTDIPAQGGVKFGPVSLDGATPSAAGESALGTAHSVTFSIAAGVNYKIVLVNNETEGSAFYWPKPWPIEGDANLDCSVNILDLIFIRNRLNQDPTTGGDLWQANVNKDQDGNNDINILDLIYVRNRLNSTCP